MHKLSFEHKKRPSIDDVDEQDFTNRKTRNRNFDNEETQLLIKLWGDPKTQLTLLTTHKKHEIYAKIAERMQMHGYDRSTEEVSYKLKNIKCLYNRLKKDIETNNLQTYPWKHYDAIDKILSRPVFKLPNPVLTPPNLNIRHVDGKSHKSQFLLLPEEDLVLCQIKDEPNDFNDNEILEYHKNKKPVGSILECQNVKETSVSFDNGISEYQIKEEPLDLIDDGIDEDVEKCIEVFETPRKKQKTNLLEEILLPEPKLVGRKILINIPTKPTSIQSNVNHYNKVLASVPSTSYVKEKVTIDTTVPANSSVKTIKIPVLPYLSKAGSSKYIVNSTVTTSKSSQRTTNTIPIQSLSSDNTVIETNNSNLKARPSGSLHLQHELSQHNISILQLNHAKQNHIGSTFIQNVIPLLEAEAQAEYSSSSTSKNPSQPVPGTSTHSFNKNLATIVEIEKKRLKIEYSRLAIEKERLKIESERFEFKKTNYNEVLLLLKSIVIIKKPTEDSS